MILVSAGGSYLLTRILHGSLVIMTSLLGLLNHPVQLRLSSGAVGDVVSDLTQLLGVVKGDAAEPKALSIDGQLNEGLVNS